MLWIVNFLKDFFFTIPKVGRQRVYVLLLVCENEIIFSVQHMYTGNGSFENPPFIPSYHRNHTWLDCRLCRILRWILYKNVVDYDQYYVPRQAP